MCGIAGIINLTSTKPIGEPLLNRMITMLNHRGPDGYGFYTNEDIGLAHARLSIIDLEGGKQPIHNEDNTVWVVFNGEIFNYVELRTKLEKRGHRFYTRTDTEVIVHAYEEYGDGFVQELNGQFAIALWDVGSKRLLLIRDRIGIVPLFYCESDGQLLFASEVKAILPATNSSPTLNPNALDQLMTFWSPVSPYTLFEGVLEISPGHMLIIENDKIKKQCYWDWQFPESINEYNSGSEQQLADELHDLLIQATQIRLRSDVPVGAYLSGGLDSSVLVALIHHYGNVPLRTFSIRFEETEFDEGCFQNQLIEHLKADHSRVNCANHDIGEAFPHTIRHTESTVLRTAPVPMGILSGHVRSQNYKVVLTGEGADEVLGGYDLFKEAKIRQFWARFPDSEIRPLILKKLYPYLDLSKGRGLTYIKSFFGAALEQPNIPWFSHIPRWNTTSKCKEFFSDSFKACLRDDAIEQFEKTLPDAINKWHPFNRSQYLEAKSLMAGYLLCSQGDRMLLSNSVEGRFPFLDHRVIEFANRLHPKIKIKVLNEKYLLKKAMAKYLPDSIVKRYKQPYRAPDIAAFFNGKWLDYVNDLLGESALKRSDYFDASKVSRLLKKIERGRVIGYKDNMALVGILSTQIWHEHFVKNYYCDYK
jgi:asparagine synthase (glutamine-hydrolysing)